MYQYYQEAAAQYDITQAGSSYMRFFQAEEERLLVPILRLFAPEKVLNLACGTGRFMEYCQYGVDFSENMLAQAIAKYPSKDFILADGENTGFPNTSFDVVVATGLFMHLPKEKTEAIFKEVHRILRPQGRFVFSVLSATRYQWLRKPTPKIHPQKWKNSQYYSLADIKEMLGENWNYVQHQGMVFLPIHRFHRMMQPHLLGLDRLLCQYLSADYASYMLITMQRDAM